MSAAAGEKSSEELPEFGVEDRVDDWVESTVDVTQPRHGAHQLWRDVTGLTPGSSRVNDEERCPAEEEDACRWRSHIT